MALCHERGQWGPHILYPVTPETPAGRLQRTLTVALAAILIGIPAFVIFTAKAEKAKSNWEKWADDIVKRYSEENKRESVLVHQSLKFGSRGGLCGAPPELSAIIDDGFSSEAELDALNKRAMRTKRNVRTIQTGKQTTATDECVGVAPRVRRGAEKPDKRAWERKHQRGYIEDELDNRWEAAHVAETHEPYVQDPLDRHKWDVHMWVDAELLCDAMQRQNLKQATRDLLSQTHCRIQEIAVDRQTRSYDHYVCVWLQNMVVDMRMEKGEDCRQELETLKRLREPFRALLKSKRLWHKINVSAYDGLQLILIKATYHVRGHEREDVIELLTNMWGKELTWSDGNKTSINITRATEEER
ncbi:unnamed protein product [Vitrella brassicaformis CCMP3155]|uniref:Uncharacterized protein n=1 Tax=Vitrella brassicaformis (strain CCMP3155) TaxID=1169540 RepID=A0A0G4GB97_VITBC|nr:unnamed protein product [Vitrella brassicaformis CCMP3155]|eukprot:CEM25940.1 unnamed protein product [Vitrella brassicaformis CCMP3155]